MNPYQAMPYLDKYNAVKDSFLFARCRLWDAVEDLKREVYKEFYGHRWMNKPKPKYYYRRWCINEWVFKWHYDERK